MANRRRNRYRFLAERGGTAAKVDVLAYTAEQARQHLESLGHYNIEQIIKRRPRISAADAMWQPNLTSIERAKSLLGLKHPVQIKLTGHLGGRQGCYVLDRRHNRVVHHITVKNWLTVEKAGETLWHELCHAMQAEACGAMTETWSKVSREGGKYWDRPVEVQARQFERRNDMMPLARPR